jgi:hypothetical protein
MSFVFVVLNYLSATTPDAPIVKQQKGQQPEQVLNNPCGYVYPYGGLQFVPAPAADAEPQPAQRNVVGESRWAMQSVALGS